jgi:signal transduction histidine kinase
MNLYRSIPAVLFSCLVAGAQTFTPAQAENIVKRAIVYAQENGMDKLIAQTNQADGRFHVGSGSELYLIILDKDGILRANGYKKDLVGTDRMVVKDPDGKFYMREVLKMANTKGSGWVDYKFPNPLTNKVEQKTTYCEAFKGYAICCGIYKK